jgi:hypothetical protein
LLFEENNFEFPEVLNVAGEHLKHPTVDVALWILVDMTNCRLAQS